MVQVNSFDLMCAGVLYEMGAMWCGGADARDRKCALMLMASRCLLGRGGPAVRENMFDEVSSLLH
jgi:hypothetical protein